MDLITEIKQCTVCEPHLELGANPVFSVSPFSKIVIIGQAPGRIVHETGVPWNDQSGDNLRSWLQVDNETFYNADLFAIVPMGFCYPGTGKSGDLPPRKECAPLWHGPLLRMMPAARLTLLIGQYAQKYYLAGRRRKNLTATVKNYRDYLPEFIPLPHPSPRNNIWQKKNPWFKDELLPELRRLTADALR
jgi:uracil-DNA glycosylase